MSDTEQNTDTNPSAPDGSPSLIQPELELALFTKDGEQRSAFTLTKSGIIIRDDLTEPEWKDGLKLFHWAQHSLKMGLSQYISFGKAKKFNVDDALAQLEFDLPTVKAALDLATVPLEMQHPNLNAEHYLVLARADDTSKTQKVKWARIAAEQHLTPPQLKASIAAGEVVSVSTTRQQQHGIVSIHGIRQEVDIWLNRVKGVEGILKMDRPHQQEILELLKPIADLYAQILKGSSGKPKKNAKKSAGKK